MNIREKSGLSPVIATVLLVSIALVLAIIIFLWARTFIGESIEKNARDIDASCEEVDFDAEAFASGELNVVNRGSVPLWGVEIREKRVIGEISAVQEFGGNTITTGATESITIPASVTINSGDKIIVVPMLLGETDTHRRAYVCDEVYGNEITVQ